MTSPPRWLARHPVYGWDVMSFAVTSLSVVAFGRWTVLPELCTFCFTNKQTNLLKKKAVPFSSTLFHLLLIIIILGIFLLSVCLRFAAGVSFSLFFLFCLSLGLLFFFHLACYCTAVLMLWSVFSVTGKQLSLIKKKKKKVGQTNQIVPRTNHPNWSSE